MMFTILNGEQEILLALDYVVSVERIGGKVTIVTLAAEPIVLDTTPCGAKGIYAAIHAAYQKRMQDEALDTAETPRQARGDRSGADA